MSAEKIAKSLYEAFEWSGCAGSAWDRLPEEIRSGEIRAASMWIKTIRANGYAVVELPEVDGELYDTLSDFFIFMDHGSSLPITTSEGGDVHRTAKDAREYAAHLLLAAAVAERDSEE